MYDQANANKPAISVTVCMRACIIKIILGVVQDVGPDCTDFNIGDRVASMHWAQDSLWPCPLGEGITTAPNDTFFGLTIDGGYAEYATNHESAFAKVPDGWTPIEAAPVMSTFGTFWMGAVVRAGLSKDDTVLVTGASGGVGAASLMISKAMGCKTIGVTSSPEKIPFVESLCPDAVICAKESDKGFVFGREQCVENGVDVVAECVGAPTFTSALRCLKPEGRLVLMGNTTNASAPLPLGLMILKSLNIHASDSIHRDDMADLFSFLNQHRIKPCIADVLPLEQA